MKSIFLSCALLALSSSSLAQTCASLADRFQSVDFSRSREVPVEPGSSTTFHAAYQECDTHDTFAGTPVPSNRQCSRDHNTVDRLVVFPDNTVVVTAKAAVDADGSELSKHHIGTSQPTTSFQLSHKSIDAEAIPYVVIPDIPIQGSKDEISFTRSTGVDNGDLAIVIKGHLCSFAIVGDKGAIYRFGEISLAAQEDLGNPQCLGSEKPCMKLKGKSGEGVGIPGGVTYIIFPHSRPANMTARDARAIAAEQGQVRADKFLSDYGAPAH